MLNSRSTKLQNVFAIAMLLLILKVTLGVMLGYRDYFPPNFASDFLRGRQDYFYGDYRFAFYVHIISGPITLFLGLILINEQLRLRFPKWHRSLGKIQVAVVFFLLAPSGLWMAGHAQTGPIAGSGFAFLAVATGLCVFFGWRSAMQRRFAQHRRWMTRCLLLLCSAVVVRLIGGMATVFDIGAAWIYPVTAWASWLVPLAVFELKGAMDRKPKQSNRVSKTHFVPPASGLSFPAMEISARR